MAPLLATLAAPTASAGPSCGTRRGTPPASPGGGPAAPRAVPCARDYAMRRLPRGPGARVRRHVVRPLAHGRRRFAVAALGSVRGRRDDRVLVVRPRPRRAREPRGEQAQREAQSLPRGAQGGRRPQARALLLPEVAREGRPGDAVSPPRRP